MIKWSFYQEDETIINMYASNNRKLKYKQKQKQNI